MDKEGFSKLINEAVGIKITTRERQNPKNYTKEKMQRKRKKRKKKRG